MLIARLVDYEVPAVTCQVQKEMNVCCQKTQTAPATVQQMLIAQTAQNRAYAKHIRVEENLALSKRTLVFLSTAKQMLIVPAAPVAKQLAEICAVHILELVKPTARQTMIANTAETPKNVRHWHQGFNFVVNTITHHQYPPISP